MSHLKSLKQTQLELTQCIRTGEGGLDGIETRRVKIYQELFFNNIEGFCSTAFPVVKSILGEEPWLQLVRKFFVESSCETPHFIEISQQFLSYVIENQTDFEPLPFLAELAHYEWVELDLAVKFDQSHFELDINTIDNDSPLTLSNTCSPLLYNYPVHTISVDNFTTIAPELTALVVYRNTDFNVKFILVDQLTVIMLQLLQQNNDINKAELATELMGLNESFTQLQMLGFLDNALPKFIELNLVTGPLKTS
ncbi:DUF2063 domain-containing protein [Psychrosphaera saromensis]|uniref:Uncharacterized protein n=1 Tax=Psychrosphaera saromensis TaxID=716813 RepID=A0A2S7UYF0_9GAMM|nr:putative DNA-binding domain-containing protein [Psychrosphaera saromensis]PQJ55017.1 hypothetical protein BTO11_16040 [Psychrosphaera saromensis]GHB55321.1 DUF2063 domain-containing protein [Psychrosphaera saromensis]GLQ13724.1 DUF2063 domain-containing protein [Psychrosphaera saromensis]